MGETPYRTNARSIEPLGLLPETRQERTDAWLELLRFVAEVVLEIVAMGW